MKRVRQIVGCDTPTDVDLPVAAFNVIGMSCSRFFEIGGQFDF